MKKDEDYRENLRRILDKTITPEERKQFRTFFKSLEGKKKDRGLR